MPAIQPARLKQQAANLAHHFDNPEKFVRALMELLEFYADRTHRPSKSGAPAPLMQSYYVAPPVLRQIILALTPRVTADPANAFTLADALWETPIFEHRTLAAKLLELIPPSSPEQILSRVAAWAKPDEEERLLEELFNKSLASLRRENIGPIFRLVEDWLNASEIETQILGLKGLLSCAQDNSFENLPYIFKLLSPILSKADADLYPYLLDVIQALARRSQQETAYYLRLNLAISEDPNTARLIRQAMPFFPNRLRASLRKAMISRK